MQLEPSDLSSQYNLSSSTGRTLSTATLGNGSPPTLYLTSSDHYVTYRDFYPSSQSLLPTTVSLAAPTSGSSLSPTGTISVTTPGSSSNGTTNGASNGSSSSDSDPYPVVRQQLALGTLSDTAGSAFLDRYLRGQSNSLHGSGDSNTAQLGELSANVATVLVNGAQFKHGLSVDLPSPDSGIGEATITPRGDQTQLPQVSVSHSFAFLMIQSRNLNHSIASQSNSIAAKDPTNHFD